MKLQYLTRGKSNSIYYRISNAGNTCLNMTKVIPFKLNPSDKWNGKLQLTNNNLNINKELVTFKAFIIDNLSDTILQNKSITKSYVTALHNQYFNPVAEAKKYEPTLLQYAKVFENNYALSESGLKRLGTLKSRLKKLPKVLIKETDIKWITNFSKLLLNQNYAESSINKHLQLIKQIVKYAELNDLEIKRNVLSFRMLKTSSITHYINEQEVFNLFNFNPSTEALNNTKKLFLIGCTTGLRISDLMRLKSFSINNGMIELTTKKTKQNIVIPIDPRIESFIEEVKPLAHQVFNRNIKDLFKDFKLNEMTKGYVIGKGNKRALGIYPKYKLMTSHCMRRSFATNLYGKLPTMVIMAITGHTTEKSFLTYIKKPQRDFAEQLKQYYSKNYS